MLVEWGISGGSIGILGILGDLKTLFRPACHTYATGCDRFFCLVIYC